MTDKPKKKSKTPYQNWLIPGAIGLVFLAGIGFLIKVMMTDVGVRQKEKIATVNLLKPPPPEVKEKPPEPEVPKEIPKETIVAPTETQQPQAQDQPQNDAPPAGADLGVEGDGGSGSDGFGLLAKGKGKGRDITLGGGGGGMNRLSLLTKYGWYTTKMQDEIKKQMRKVLDQSGGMPKGKFQSTVKIQLDAKGSVVKFQIIASSGNTRMDEALNTSLPGFRVSQPPPEGMPTGMTVRIISQG